MKYQKHSTAKKAIFAGLTSMALAAAVMAPTAAFASYAGHSDIPADHWAVTGGVIDWSEDHGVVNGFPDGTWGADKTIDRAQAVAILYNLDGAPQLGGIINFADAQTLDWALMPALWAQENGIFTGTVNPDGTVTFDPWDGLTREQAAKILCVYAGGDENMSDTVLADYRDASSVSDWARGVVSWAVENGIMGNGGFLQADRVCTRAEFVAMVKSTYELMNPGSSETPSDPDTPSEDVKPSEPSNPSDSDDDYEDGIIQPGAEPDFRPGDVDPETGKVWTIFYEAEDGTRFDEYFRS